MSRHLFSLLVPKTGPTRIGIKKLLGASRNGVPSRQGLAPSSTVKELIALLRKSAARREMCIETRTGPSSGGAAWKNRFAAFYAAPNGAWRLRELDFYKHDASTALTRLTLRAFQQSCSIFCLQQSSQLSTLATGCKASAMRASSNVPGANSGKR